MRLAGRESGPDMPEYYSPGTVEAYIEAAKAALAAAERRAGAREHSGPHGFA